MEPDWRQAALSAGWLPPEEVRDKVASNFIYGVSVGMALCECKTPKRTRELGWDVVRVLGQAHEIRLGREATQEQRAAMVDVALKLGLDSGA